MTGKYVSGGRRGSEAEGEIYFKLLALLRWHRAVNLASPVRVDEILSLPTRADGIRRPLPVRAGEILSLAFGAGEIFGPLTEIHSRSHESSRLGVTVAKVDRLRHRDGCEETSAVDEGRGDLHDD